MNYYAVWHFFEPEGFKKACTPVSRIVSTSTGGTRNRGFIKAGLI